MHLSPIKVSNQLTPGVQCADMEISYKTHSDKNMVVMFPKRNTQKCNIAAF